MMRGLARNKQTFYFANCKKEDKILDENGHFTGEYAVDYGDPIRAKGNISATRGESRTMQFGNDVDYSRVITTCNPKISIDKDSIVWIGKEPLDNDTPYNYIVKAVARSLNSVSIAIQEVSVSE